MCITPFYLWLVSFIHARPIQWFDNKGWQLQWVLGDIDLLLTSYAMDKRITQPFLCRTFHSIHHKCYQKHSTIKVNFYGSRYYKHSIEICFCFHISILEHNNIQHNYFLKKDCLFQGKGVKIIHKISQENS